MSKYDYEDYSSGGAAPSRLDIWDMLSILTVVMTLCIGAYFVAIFMTPNAAYNLLAPSRNQAPTPTRSLPR